MDTERNIAISEEQKLIARATMRDSSSMKIIATMTMIFFPATFFSTLFAMPALKWEPTLHAHPQFWIYLVCSVLSTTLVLIVWYRTVKDTEARALAEIDNVKARPAEKQSSDISDTIQGSTSAFTNAGGRLQALVKLVRSARKSSDNEAVVGAERA